MSRLWVGVATPRLLNRTTLSNYIQFVMAIVINLDLMLARRKMTLSELAERVDISIVNLSVLKTGKARAVRFSTLDAICEALDCQPGDIIEHRKGISL